MISSFIFAVMATLGFCIIFQVPLKHIPAAAIVGGVGWVINLLCIDHGISSVVACFFAACAVGLFSDICSRFFKDAATIFIIPGILPLVPGSGMYNTMIALVQNDLTRAASVGSQTIFLAGAIALALLVVGGFIRIAVMAKRKIIRPRRHGD